MADRRTFLRGLATLPLIGGSVALIGKPTAAAVPVTADLLDRYMDFMAIELREKVIESREIAFAKYQPDIFALYGDKHIREDVQAGMWAPEKPKMKRLLDISGRPSTRAAIVLSAVGCPLTSEGAL